MSDFEKLANEATTKAVLAVGRDAAKRAVDDLLAGQAGSKPKAPEPTEHEAKASKAKRWKYAAVGVLGLFLAIGVIGLVMHFWYWFLAAGVLGIAGYVGYTMLRRRVAKGALPAEEKQQRAKDLELEDAEVPALRAIEAKRVAPVREAKAIASKTATKELDVDASDPEGDARRAELAARRAKLEARKAELEARTRAAEAEAIREQEVDDELAAMKARLKRSGDLE